MFRSLHMKLMLIMTLLIVSLMVVVGAFLINSVVGYYLNVFHTQMSEAFTDVTFITDLSTAEEGEEDGAQMLAGVLYSYTRTLGVDNRSRWYYVLDGKDGVCLASSDEESEYIGKVMGITPNLSTALSGESGTESDPSASYMDMAFVITRGSTPYIVYIVDSKETVNSLNQEFITLIMAALLFGVAISVLLSFLLSKTLTTPIERLTEGAERVAGGDFSHKLEVSAKDEIGVLTKTFNSMAQRLQETLRKEENERNKLNTLFLHMKDGVVAFSRDGVVIHANPAAEGMLGRKIPIGGTENYDTLFGDIAPFQSVLDVVQPEYLDGRKEVDGRSLELIMVPFDKERLGGVMAVIHDVTEQYKTENMRREFVANVSHELRTPLTNIRSYAETLAENSGALPRETEQSFLGVILNESDRMTSIVQDLLTLSRFDSGYSELQLGRFSFADAVRDVYKATLLEMQRHGHTMTLEYEDNMPDIIGDRERIVQVMVNVVSNAMKYTPDGGKIELKVGHREEWVWMMVSDNGIGIPAEDRERIFDRFYRVDKARSRQSGGTGLGLSIAKEIIDRHQGILELVDKPEPGLCIRLQLLIEGPRNDEQD